MNVLNYDPLRRGLASLILNVPYTNYDGHEECMHILHPQDISLPGHPRHPLIVFVQGSGWTKPNFTYEIPQLSEFARAGYVVATIDHRHAKEAPGRLGFLEDAKAAIRFLRANAAQYGIDPERVCIWGTSSGGNTALLVGMTWDKPEFDVGDHLEQSSRVQLVVDTFGPADLASIVKARFTDRDNYDPESTFAYLAGGFPGDNIPLFEKMSPACYVAEGKELPPMLIMNGTDDAAVSYESSFRFYRQMKNAGYDVDFLNVQNGPHEVTFWTPEVFSAIHRYIDERL